MSKVNVGTLPSTLNTFSVLLDSVCAVTALITNCDKSQTATVVSQFVTVAICDGSKQNFSDWCQYCLWYTSKYRKHVHIDFGPFQGVFLGTSIMDIITDIHANIYTSEITPKWAEMQFFIFMPKMNMGNSPKYTEHVFSVIGLNKPRQGLDHKLQQITNCDDSVAICDCCNL